MCLPGALVAWFRLPCSWLHAESFCGLSFPRNVLTESARIARGKITDLAKLRTADHDAAIFPGGFGAAKNLCVSELWALSRSTWGVGGPGWTPGCCWGSLLLDAHSCSGVELL